MAEEEAEEKRGPRFRWRVVRLVAIVTVIVLAVVVTGLVVWNSKPSEDDLKEQAGLIGKAELLVGVHKDVPGVSYLDPETGRYKGFEIDIAYLVAADLGFRPHEVEFLFIENEDRSRMLSRYGDRHVTVDLVLSTYSITEEREREPTVSFSDPYLITEQSVMTLRGHPSVQDLTDLAGSKVCTISTSTSQVEAKDAGGLVVHKNKISECLPGLRSGEFEAVTSDAALLAGWVASEPDVYEHHDIGLSVQESWGINTGGDEALRTLVNLALYRSRNDPEDRRWEDAYDRHLRPLERASLPQPVAIDEQPDVREVEIRQWPWEMALWTAPGPGPRSNAASSGRSRSCRRSRSCCSSCGSGT